MLFREEDYPKVLGLWCEYVSLFFSFPPRSSDVITVSRRVSHMLLVYLKYSQVTLRGLSNLPQLLLWAQGTGLDFM